MPLAMFLAAAAAPCPARATLDRVPVRLDAHFVANRVLVALPATEGSSVRFWTDSGGGSTILYTRTTDRLHIPTAPLPDDGEPDAKGMRMPTGPLPFACGAFPLPPSPVGVSDDLKFDDFTLSGDVGGNLGQNWFGDHIWTWDYPAGTLTIESRGWKPARGAHVIPATFKTGKDGKADNHFLRITVSIAGEDVALLLDTGASTVLTAEVAKQLGEPRLQATSMITASRIARWHAAHPDWQIIERAQSGTGSRMIRVPDVKIAGIEVGPVWFTERPDRNFTVGMSGEMRGPVEGALGGNAYRDLRMTVDYTRSIAAFIRCADGVAQES